LGFGSIHVGYHRLSGSVELIVINILIVAEIDHNLAGIIISIFIAVERLL
jgi:hypothetical protein